MALRESMEKGRIPVILSDVAYIGPHQNDQLIKNLASKFNNQIGGKYKFYKLFMYFMWIRG